MAYRCLIEWAYFWKLRPEEAAWAELGGTASALAHCFYRSGESVDAGMTYSDTLLVDWPRRSFTTN